MVPSAKTGALTMHRSLLALTAICACFVFSPRPMVQSGDGQPPPSPSQARSASPASRLLADVVRLSGPDFGGRQTGTAEDLASARYVAERFQALGLQPAGNAPLDGETPGPAWAQAETVDARRILAPARLELSAPLALTADPGSDFLPFLDSPSVQLSAPVVFVGYGISDPDHGVDDYAGLDVSGRVVLFLRGKPDGYAGQASHHDKASKAREKGAVAFLTASGPVLPAYEARRGMGPRPMAAYSQWRPGEPALPGAWITTELAEQLLSAAGGSLKDSQEALNRGKEFRSLATPVTVRLAWETRQERGWMVNVLARLPGQDPESGTVVLGAHRDHFGQQAGLLFAGADDNASGTAVLLDVARAMAQASAPAKRSVLFVSFSGEERGLLGSRLYVSQPGAPLASTAAMLNVDHAGVGNGRLTVGLTGLAREAAIAAGQAAGLADRLDLYGFFPGGDHVPFKEAGVPTATVVSAGPHPHFHQPSDRAETIQPEILETASRFLLALAWQLANEP